MKKFTEMNLFVIGLLGLSSCASHDAETLVAIEKPVSVEQKFQEIMLMTEKLYFIKESSAEVDALEKEGLSKFEADRMRLAMKHKKRELTRKTAHLISVL